jgi:hypothetical protein
MNYQTMQSQARSKHQQLRQEAQNHRLARQSKSGPIESGRSSYTLKLAGAFVGLTTIAAVVNTLF